MEPTLTKKCAFCAEEIAVDAVKCKHCGEYQSPEIRNYMQPVNAPAPQLWSPGVAAVLSFFIPGVGQMYKGSIGMGILWLIFVGIGYALFIFPGVILHIICIAMAYSGDPTKR